MGDERQTSGKISSGIPLGTSVQKTLQFVETQLPKWRDMPGRASVEAEEELNSQLCKFLNAAARNQNFSMAYFHHEERQTARRRVDLSALSPEPLIEGRSYFNLEPFLVLEGKRLPAPSIDREREYVTGTNAISGGIERFKQGLHGGALRQAGMIAYVQNDSSEDWFPRINHWIEELTLSLNTQWTDGDRLMDFIRDPEARTARCQSSHSRQRSVSPNVNLTHLWVEMRCESISFG